MTNLTGGNMFLFSYNGVIENKTPHEITILDKDGVIDQVIPAVKGDEWRLDEVTTLQGYINGIRVTKTEYCCSQLPEPKEGVWYIVSALFKLHYPNRNDLLVPAEVYRNGSKVVGCLSLGI